MAKISFHTEKWGNVNGTCAIELITDKGVVLLVELCEDKLSVHSYAQLPVISDYSNKVIMQIMPIKSAIPGAAGNCPGEAPRQTIASCKPEDRPA
jgi:hypothetical protein